MRLVSAYHLKGCAENPPAYRHPHTINYLASPNTLAGWEPSQPPTCDATRWPHTLDVAGGAATLTGPAMLAWVLADPEDCRSDEGFCGAFAIWGAVIAAVSATYWTAAVRGYRMANRCDLARRSHHAWEGHEEWRRQRKKPTLAPARGGSSWRRP